MFRPLTKPAISRALLRLSVFEQAGSLLRDISEQFPAPRDAMKMCYLQSAAIITSWVFPWSVVLLRLPLRSNEEQRERAGPRMGADDGADIRNEGGVIAEFGEYHRLELLRVLKAVAV